MIFKEIPPVLKSLLFLCRCDFQLSPIVNVGPVAEAEGFRWKSTGVEPSFSIRFRKSIFGWLIVRVKIRHDFVNALLLQLDFGSGAGRGDGEALPLIRVTDNEYQALAFLSAGTRRACFNLGGYEGKFSIEEFELYNVPGVLVRRIGFKALSTHHRKFRGAPERKVRKMLLKQSCNSGMSLDKVLEEHIRALIEPEKPVNYDTWIREVEIPYNEAQLERYKDTHKRKYHEPLISILLPVFNSPDSFLRDCLDSVLAQTYTNWELCIADDASSLPHVRQILEEYNQMDERIRVTIRISNGGISAASNTALQMARGDYLVLLDHDDTLAPNALLSVIEVLQRNPRPRILYSDEDKIDADGRRYSPHFKSDWNPDLLYSQNYVSHLGVYESELIQNIGGFREGFEGSQDYDLLLRASARVDERQIRHIPLVLYHWRASKGSAASQAEPKLYAWDAGVRALQSFFATNANGVCVGRGVAPFTYRPRWPLPDPPPLVSVIVPTRDNRELLATCISSVLEKTAYPNLEILLVDNNSRDKSTRDYLVSIGNDERVRILRYPGAFNYSAINNFAAAKAKGEFLGLLNDDIEVIEENWLSEMVSHACRPEIGCVGAKLIYPDGRIQHAGVICGIGGVAGHSHKYFMQEEGGYFSRLLLIQNLSAVTAACLVVHRSVWCAVGGMNSTELPISFNDVDFCLRVQQLGLRNIWTPYALLTHHESASRGIKVGKHNKQQILRESKYMKDKWGKYLTRDPYYSLHLTLKHEDFSIKGSSLDEVGSYLSPKNAVRSALF